MKRKGNSKKGKFIYCAIVIETQNHEIEEMQSQRKRRQRMNE